MTEYKLVVVGGEWNCWRSFIVLMCLALIQFLSVWKALVHSRLFLDTFTAGGVGKSALTIQLIQNQWVDCSLLNFPEPSVFTLLTEIRNYTRITVSPIVLGVCAWAGRGRAFFSKPTFPLVLLLSSRSTLPFAEKAQHEEVSWHHNEFLLRSQYFKERFRGWSDNWARYTVVYSIADGADTLLCTFMRR